MEEGDWECKGWNGKPNDWVYQWVDQAALGIKRGKYRYFFGVGTDHNFYYASRSTWFVDTRSMKDNSVKIRYLLDNNLLYLFLH